MKKICLTYIMNASKIWLCVCIVLAISILTAWLLLPSKEYLTSTFTTETDISDIPIQPMFHDPATGTIMSGSETNANGLLAPWYNAYVNNMNNHYMLDDGANRIMGLQYDNCSKSCCSAQYPTPFDLAGDPAICKNKSKYVPNNYTCNNQWQDTGCVCMTREQSNFIGNRGGNSP